MAGELFKNKKAITYIFAALMCAVCGLVFYSFVTAPYTGDIEVFMAAANQAKYYRGNVLMRVFEAWELKGIFNRLVIYAVYSLTKLFVSYTDVAAFELCSKVVYGILAVAVISVSMCLLPGEPIRKKLIYGTAVFLSVFATYTAVQLQAEMTVVILSVLVFSCTVSEKRGLVILGGVIGALFFFSKSVFILLYFSTLLGAFIYKKNLKKGTVLLSVLVMACTEVLLLVLVRVTYPGELMDMKNAADFQSTLFTFGSNVSLVAVCTTFLNYLNQSIVAIPCLLVSFICTAGLLFEFKKDKDHDRIIAVIFSWLISVDIIVASNTYFIYHYFILMIPGMTGMITYLSRHDINPLGFILSVPICAVAMVFCSKMKNGLIQWGFINYSTVLLVIIHVLLIGISFFADKNLKRFSVLFSVLVMTVVLFFWGNYSSVFAPKHRNEVDLLRRSEEISENSFPDDFGDEPVLFLDGGTVPFYADAPSYSRYFFNLPMQRWNTGKNWSVQKSEYEKMLNYSGKYIVYSDWFGLDKYPELKEKIMSGYSVLSNSGIYTFSPDWNVFSLSPLPDVKDARVNSDTYIYVRNDFIDRKNYLKPDLQETVSNGVTIRPNGDGTYTVNGTATALTVFCFGTYSLESGTYKLVGCPGDSDSYYADCRNDDGSQLTDRGNGAVFSTTGQSGYACRLVISEGAVLSDVVVKPMITNDTSAVSDDYTAFE